MRGVCLKMSVKYLISCTPASCHVLFEYLAGYLKECDQNILMPDAEPVTRPMYELGPTAVLFWCVAATTNCSVTKKR
jgi:hypothetical protein